MAPHDLFFAGTLQEGIGAAVQQQKRVVCFVSDGAPASSTWETDYLAPLQEPLQDHAVVLKIHQGSSEAGFLAAICPIEVAPMVVVISNGQVKNALRPPMDVQQFRQAILQAMDLNFTLSTPAGQAAGSGPRAPVIPAQQAEQQAVSDSVSDPPASQATSTDPKATELARVNREARERRRLAADERRRVLDRIEADKEDRRQAAQARLEEREMLQQQQQQQQQQNLETDHGDDKLDSKTAPSTAITSKPRPNAIHKNARLQLRYSDSQVERAEFPASDPLSSIRNWMTANGKLPSGLSGAGYRHFVFKPVLGAGAAPQISAEDEAKSLAELGLTPSATLIVHSVASAPSSSLASGSVFGRLWALLVAILTPLVALVTGLLGRLGGAVASRAESLDDNAVTDRRGRAGRASGVRDADDSGSGSQGGGARSTAASRKKRDRPNLYNGNQTSVLPNDGTSDDDDDGHPDADRDGSSGSGRRP